MHNKSNKVFYLSIHKEILNKTNDIKVIFSLEGKKMEPVFFFKIKNIKIRLNKCIKDQNQSKHLAKLIKIVQKSIIRTTNGNILFCKSKSKTRSKINLDWFIKKHLKFSYVTSLWRRSIKIEFA